MNKYEKIFTKEDGEDIVLSYELKKANYVIRNLIDQRNSVLNEIAMVRAECFMLNEDLEKYKETEEEEIKKENEEEVPNAEE
tara:strand:+ start:311 stop:556 length:246 start_codon:yes stop_codon:yes gene_type:complete